MIPPAGHSVRPHEVWQSHSNPGRDIISELPPEILHQIVSYVPYEQRVSLLFVSKLFSEIAAEENTKEPKIDLKGIYKPRELRFYLNKFKKLQTLTLACDKLHVNHYVIGSLKRDISKTLCDLRLSQVHLHTEAFWPIRFPSTKILVLHNVKVQYLPETIYPLGIVFRSFPKLQQLGLRSLTGAMLAPGEARRIAPTVTTIELSDMLGINDGFVIETLRRVKSLEDFTINSCYNLVHLTEGSMAKLASHATTLQKLTLKGVYHDSDLTPLVGHHRLTELTMRGFVSLTVDRLTHLCSWNMNMTHLTLIECQIGDEHLSVFHRMPSLNSLDLSFNDLNEPEWGMTEEERENLDPSDSEDSDEERSDDEVALVQVTGLVKRTGAGIVSIDPDSLHDDSPEEDPLQDENPPSELNQVAPSCSYSHEKPPTAAPIESLILSYNTSLTVRGTLTTAYVFRKTLKYLEIKGQEFSWTAAQVGQLRLFKKLEVYPSFVVKFRTGKRPGWTYF